MCPGAVSYLPEKESQESQQQQPEQDGQHDDPPGDPRIRGSRTPLWEHSQSHLGEQSASGRTLVLRSLDQNPNYTFHPVYLHHIILPVVFYYLCLSILQHRLVSCAIDIQRGIRYHLHMM